MLFLSARSTQRLRLGFVRAFPYFPVSRFQRKDCRGCGCAILGLPGRLISQFFASFLAIPPGSWGNLKWVAVCWFCWCFAGSLLVLPGFSWVFITSQRRFCQRGVQSSARKKNGALSSSLGKRRPTAPGFPPEMISRKGDPDLF